jgi:DNA-directed RNA polymerase specialized sigma24 family protein
MGSNEIRGNRMEAPTDEALALECVRRTWTLAIRLLADARAAETVTLGAIESVTRTYARLSHGPELWIRVRDAAIEQSLAHLRERASLRPEPHAFEAEHLGDGPGRAYVVPRDGAELNDLVARLPNAERVVFTLATLERLSDPAVAQALGVTEDEVRLLLHSAWAGLRGLCIER